MERLGVRSGGLGGAAGGATRVAGAERDGAERTTGCDIAGEAGRAAGGAGGVGGVTVGRILRFRNGRS